MLCLHLEKTYDVSKKNGLFGIAARGWIDTSYIKPHIEITW